jgi:hypothetical protein
MSVKPGISLIESDNHQYLIYTYANLEECWKALEKTKHLFLEANDFSMVVIDGSFEGSVFQHQQEEHKEEAPSNCAAFSKIHTLLSEYRTGPTVLVYGDANLKQNYFQWCRDNNSSPIFTRFLYRPQTLLQRSLEFYNLNPPKPNLSFKPKHFICLNGVARRHRVEMVNSLYEKDWHLKGYISWLRRGSNSNDGWLAVQNHQNFDQTTLKLDFDREDLVEDIDGNQLLCPPQYSGACFDIVNETSVSDSVLFITDKTWKPILQKTPFIIHGSKNTHKHLEEYFGIKPYTDLFDYRFDTLDYNERFTSIKDDNLERLLNMDINELNEIVNSDKMQELLEYNKKQLLTHFIDNPKDIRLLGLSESGIGENLLTHSIVNPLTLLGY